MKKKQKHISCNLSRNRGFKDSYLLLKLYQLTILSRLQHQHLHHLKHQQRKNLQKKNKQKYNRYRKDNTKQMHKITYTLLLKCINLEII